MFRQPRDRLKPAGYVVTIAVPAKTSEEIPWLQGYVMEELARSLIICLSWRMIGAI
ncbi:spore germination protein YaaH [Geobacillus subterraneus]